MPDITDFIPDRVVPRNVYMIPAPTNRNQVPSMVHAIADYHGYGHPKFLQNAGICQGIAVADPCLFHQHAIGCVGYAWDRFVQIVLVIVFTFQYKVVVGSQRFFQIRHPGIICPGKGAVYFPVEFFPLDFNIFLCVAIIYAAFCYQPSFFIGIPADFVAYIEKGWMGVDNLEILLGCFRP